MDSDRHSWRQQLCHQPLWRCGLTCMPRPTIYAGMFDWETGRTPCQFQQKIRAGSHRIFPGIPREFGGWVTLSFLFCSARPFATARP